jgi:penicillin amidase
LPQPQPTGLLFNALLHSLAGVSSGIINNYDWFQNMEEPGAPQTADAIIVQALDTVLVMLGDRPWGINARGVITYDHALLGPVHTTPLSQRSTYAHIVEFGHAGPSRIESMFPLGESGTILGDPVSGPSFDPHFFSMTPEFDSFEPRVFPLFDD